MKWKKLGRLYYIENLCEELFSHCANPLPVHLENDIYRVYFSGRDIKNRSSVGAVDIDIVKRQIIQEYKTPFFKCGKENSFYEDGVSIGNCYEANGEKYILFMGWQTKNKTHWRGDIGQLKLNYDYSLILSNEQPYITTDEIDKISLSYPWVEKINDNKYLMYYGSTINWQSENGEMIHVINYAVSNDGINWQKKGLAVPYEYGMVQAFSRPSVIKIKNNYNMWVSSRGPKGIAKYRIYHSKSADGINWEKITDNKSAGIDVSNSGWDSEMVCYPYVFKHKNNIFMLYNGNGYGKTGFGIAILEEE
ncbi:hypothetical protein IJG14_08110 [bacterium]|nr:hypothetical protein [bacterium]